MLFLSFVTFYLKLKFSMIFSILNEPILLFSPHKSTNEDTILISWLIGDMLFSLRWGSTLCAGLVHRHTRVWINPLGASGRACSLSPALPEISIRPRTLWHCASAPSNTHKTASSIRQIRETEEKNAQYLIEKICTSGRIIKKSISTWVSGALDGIQTNVVCHACSFCTPCIFIFVKLCMSACFDLNTEHAEEFHVYLCI